MRAKQRSDKATPEGCLTMRMCEMGVIGVTIVLVLHKSYVLLPSNSMTLLVGCLSCQFLALTIKTFKDDMPHDHKHYFRSRADPGYLCSLLVPLALVADILNVYGSSIITDIRYINTILGYACFTSTQTALYIITTRSTDTDKIGVSVTRWLSSILISLAEISSGLLVAKTESSLIVLILCEAYVIFCSLDVLPPRLPQCFTVGELTCVVQLFGVVFWRSLHTLKNLTGSSDFAFSTFRIDCIQTILYVAIAVILSTYQFIINPKRGRKAATFYCLGGAISLLFVIPASHYILEQDLVSWMLAYIFGHTKRMVLFLYWVFFSMVASVIVYIGNKEREKSRSKTIVRKYFHLLVLAVYVPGLLVDAQFLHLASVFAGAFLVLLEAIRVHAIPPLGEVLETSFRLFMDEKDEGRVILSHIYLLVGLSMPLWITNTRPVLGSHLSAYSGVLALGVGDTAASVGGTLLGQHKWPGSKKSIEGSVCCALSQGLGLCLLIYTDAVSTPLTVALAAPVILSSLYEASTLQIDNLVLPLLTYTIFCVA